MEENGSAESSVRIEALPTAICRCRSGTITDANTAAGRVFGTAPGELAGAELTDLVIPEDRESVATTLEDARARTPADDPASVRFEIESDREQRIVESEWTADGEGVLGTLRDVTDRVRRERDLERESEMLDSLLSNVPMSIYFKDRRSRHERVSTHMLCSDPDSYITNAEGKMHAHPEDVIGKTDYDIYGPDIAVPGVEEDEEVMETEEPVFNEVTESTTNLGEAIYTSTTKAPRYDEDGNVVGVVGVTMDVTERMTAVRELERQNERLEEFTEVLTHDLRNPLQVARGNVDLLAETYDDERVDTVADSLGRIAELIDEIRSFVIQGRTVQSPEPVDVATVAREAWLAVDTAEATLSIETERTVEADPSRVRRLLENLYCNAVEHGGEDVAVTVGDTDTGFYVADDGPGISEEDRAKVFDRGFTTGEEGTGFGLAIVRNIAGAHDWEVSVTDGAEGGARFEFDGVVRLDESANDHF